MENQIKKWKEYIKFIEDNNLLSINTSQGMCEKFDNFITEMETKYPTKMCRCFFIEKRENNI